MSGKNNSEEHVKASFRSFAGAEVFTLSFDTNNYELFSAVQAVASKCVEVAHETRASGIPAGGAVKCFGCTHRLGKTMADVSRCNLCENYSFYEPGFMSAAKEKSNG